MFSSGGVRMSRVRHSGRPISFGSDSPAEGGVRNRAYRPEPGVAAGLHRVRDHRRRNLRRRQIADSRARCAPPATPLTRPAACPVASAPAASSAPQGSRAAVAPGGPRPADRPGAPDRTVRAARARPPAPFTPTALHPLRQVELLVQRRAKRRDPVQVQRQPLPYPAEAAGELRPRGRRCPAGRRRRCPQVVRHDRSAPRAAWRCRTPADMRTAAVLQVTRGPRTATRTDPAGPAGRRREILALVADGLTNAEIAARLVLSVREDDHHASAVLTKLGMTPAAKAADTARHR